MSICRTFVAVSLLAATALTPVGVAHAQTEPESKLSGPGAPPPDLVRSPGSARVTQVVNLCCGWGATVGLYDCANASSSIICYFVFRRIGEGPQDYKINDYMTDARLIDNFHVQHHLTGRHLYNGLGEVQDMVDLDKGESIWTTVEFEAGRYPIKSARILWWSFQFTTAVK